MHGRVVELHDRAAEAPHLIRFPGERLDDAHAARRLLGHVRHLGQRVLYPDRRGADAPAQIDHRQGDDRHDKQDEQRQPPVEPEQQRRRANDGNHLPQQDDQVPGDRLLQQGHVVGQARHQLARPPLGVEAERQLLQVGVDIDANVGHGVLADVGQSHLLDEGKERLEDEDDDQRHRHPVQIDEVLVDEDKVDQIAHHQRQHQPQQGTDYQSKDGYGHPAPVGANVAQQAGEGCHPAASNRRGVVRLFGLLPVNSSSHGLVLQDIVAQNSGDLAFDRHRQRRRAVAIHQVDSVLAQPIVDDRATGGAPLVEPLPVEEARRP